MDYFEKANLLVVPVQATEYRGERIKYPNYSPNYKPGNKPFPMGWQGENSKNWVNWEEREEFYPGVTDWFALGGLVTRGRYFMDGMEIGYGVIDVDNHGTPEKFQKTVEFLSSIGWDDTLIVQTPSGGRHYYFWCLADYLPNHTNGNDEYSIEFKTKGGWLVPNGRDRIIISNKPIKRLSLTKDNPLTQMVSIKKKKLFSARRPTNPDFPIEEEPFPEVGPGDRHNTLMAKACSLFARGCPPEKIQWWGEEFYRRTNRKQQPNEISNIVRDAVRYVDDEGDVNEQLLVELKQEAEEDAQDTDVLTNLLEGAEELTGWEAAFAEGVFEGYEELKQTIKKYLATVPKGDKAIVRPLITTDLNKMARAWSAIPGDKQVEYEWMKDTMKMLAEKP